MEKEVRIREIVRDEITRWHLETQDILSKRLSDANEIASGDELYQAYIEAHLPEYRFEQYSMAVRILLLLTDYEIPVERWEDIFSLVKMLDKDRDKFKTESTSSLLIPEESHNKKE